MTWRWEREASGALSLTTGLSPIPALEQDLGGRRGVACWRACVACPPGAHDVDEHFRTAPFEDNIPVLLGLTGVWNTTFLGYPSMAILPYTQALSKLAPHIQQVLLLSARLLM